MKYAVMLLGLLVGLFVGGCAGEQKLATQAALAGLASSDPAVAEKSVANLRAVGPQGLKTLLDLYDQSHNAKLLPAIDAVAAQHNAVWSRLYWYTDLAQAEAAAREQKKPILYLRLLGNLTDEYSCANSRFFRTVLYANTSVSKLLRERFILVWQSERPIPIITIDYGDGRVLKRTITGNSIHYILNCDGQVIDALPGLYSPAAFTEILEQAIGVASSKDNDGSRRLRYASQSEDWLLRGWMEIIDDHPKLNLKKVSYPENADAVDAGRTAVSKSMGETPLLRAMSPQFAAKLDESMVSTDGPGWQQIAALYPNESRLDDSSIALIRSQNPSAYTDDKTLKKTVGQFEQLIEVDTLRNNFIFRRKILGWLRESKGQIKLDDLNRRVYRELFLTPDSDPWLGLAPADTYTALTNGGVREKK